MKFVAIVDNRLPDNYDGFEMESVYTSLHKNIFELLASFQVVSEQHQNWLGNISNIAIASSPSTSRLISKVEVPSLFEALAFRFTASATSQLWSYVSEALNKISSQIKVNTTSINAGLILVIITDLSFYNDQIMESEESAFGAMCSTITKLMSEAFTIRIVCIQTKLLHLTNNELDIRRLELKLQSIRRTCLDQLALTQRKEHADKFQIIIIENHPIYFEEELKMMIQYAMTPITNCKLALTLPPSSCSNDPSMKLSISYTIHPISLDSMKAMHTGLQVPEVYSIIPRTHLHPACIKGNTLLITPSNEHAQSQPRIAYTALISLLIQKDWLLILKLKHSVHMHTEYWCVIPPAPTTPSTTTPGSIGNIPPNEQLFMIQLLDNESLINYTLSSGSTGGLPIPSGTTNSRSINTNQPSISANDLMELNQYLYQYMEQALVPWTPVQGEGEEGPFYNPLVAVSGSTHRKVSQLGYIHTIQLFITNINTMCIDCSKTTASKIN